jgi:hypothetical protein
LVAPEIYAGNSGDKLYNKILHIGFFAARRIDGIELL